MEGQVLESVGGPGNRKLVEVPVASLACGKIGARNGTLWESGFKNLRPPGSEIWSHSHIPKDQGFNVKLAFESMNRRMKIAEGTARYILRNVFLLCHMRHCQTPWDGHESLNLNPQKSKGLFVAVCFY